MFRAVPPAVPARRSQPVNASRLSALIPADPSASRAPTAALPESNRHTERFPVLALWLTRLPLDQIGPIGKNAADCAALLETITSHDEKDSTSMERTDTDFTSAIGKDIRGMKIGIPKEYLSDGLDDDVRAAIKQCAAYLKECRADVEYFDLGLMEYTIPAYYVIAAAEASSNLERFDGVKYGYRAKEYEGLHDMYKRSRSEGFGPEVKRRIMLGSFVLSSGYYDAYYLKALKVRALIKKAFDDAFCKSTTSFSDRQP